jgi:hypothetical protein
VAAIMITTDHLNAALDLAAARGLTAKDIRDLKIGADGELEAVVIRAALPGARNAKFTVMLKPSKELLPCVTT